ncbi:MAG TPA: lipopolysaccharide assembly protein LapA domain-containing protein [Sphingomonadaceae bacterium]|nr:lipopolysaccharide assembly protein LapA domain-containing protein [Sphingomonadaceae bacterium]
MQFLRSLFWVIVAVAMLIFAVQNNGVVTVNLWGGLQADVKLWLLVLGPLLVGFLPTWIFGRVSLWQQKRQARAAAERAQLLPTYEMPSASSPAGLGVTGNTQSLPSAASPAS